MDRPRRIEYDTLKHYLSDAIAFCNKQSLTKTRYDIVCDIIRHSCAEYPKLCNSPDPNNSLWKKVQQKLRQLAASGVRAVSIWWRVEWGTRPDINLNGEFSRLYVQNRPVRRALRRRRLLIIRVLMRAGIPQDVYPKILDYIGI